MTNFLKVTGTFKNNRSVADCLGYICRLNIPDDKISVSGLDSNNAPNTDFFGSDDLLGSSLRLTGAIVFIGIFFCAYIANVQMALLLVWLMICTVAPKALFHLPCEQQESQCVRGRVEIAICVSKLSEQNAVRAIMQEFGAVVTLEIQKSDFGPKLEPPPLFPS